METSELLTTTTTTASAQALHRWLLEQEDELPDATAATTATTADSNSNMVSAVLSNIFLFFLIFGLSATVNVKNLKRQLSNHFAIGCGVAMQFLIMPLLGFVAVTSMRSQLTHAMGVSLLVVTTSPGGSYSNWWCSMFNADLALSVAMTTVSSILSIGLLPANLLLYTYLAYGVTGDDGESKSVLEALNFKTLFVSLGIVLAAITSGLLAGCRWDSPRFRILANRFGSICGVLLIVFSLFLSSGVDGSTSNTFWNQSGFFYIAVAFPCLVGVALANIIARSVKLSPPETVAIAIECCYQNTGIATSVAITMFEDKEERAQAVAVPLFYGVVEAVAIAIYCCCAWKWGWTKAPPNEKFCVVLAKTYEVEDGEDGDTQEEERHDKHHDDDDGIFHQDDDDSNGSGLEPQAPSQQSSATGRRTIVVEQGAWGRFFPPVLRRMSSSISLFGSGGMPPELDPSHSQDEDDGGDKKPTPGKLELPMGTEDEGDNCNRNRFVSADYTAETSSCSALSSPLAPETPVHDYQPSDVIILKPLTIPEVPSEIWERSDESDAEEAGK